MDEIERENRHLKKQLEARPKLSLVPRDEEHSHIVVNLPIVPDSSDTFINDNLSAIKKKVPVINQVYAKAALWGAVDYRPYNAKLESHFYPQYKLFLEEFIAYASRLTRVVPVNLRLKNIGNSPASDIRVQLEFPEYVLLSHDMEKPPTMPSPPEQPVPETFKQLARMSTSYSSFSPPVFTPKVKPISNLSETRIKANFVSFTVRKLQHNDSVVIPEFFGTLSDNQKNSGFLVNFTVVADELPTESGQLSVKIQRIDKGWPKIN